MAGYALTLTAVSLLFIALTYGMYRFFPKKKLMIYIPTILALVATLYFFYVAKTAHTGFTDLAAAVMASIFFTGVIAGTITGLFFDFIIPRLKH